MLVKFTSSEFCPSFSDWNICVHTFLCHFLKFILVIELCYLYLFLDRASSLSQNPSSSSRTSTSMSKKPQSTLMSQIGADLNRSGELPGMFSSCFYMVVTFMTLFCGLLHVCSTWFSWDFQLNSTTTCTHHGLVQIHFPPLPTTTMILYNNTL